MVQDVGPLCDLRIVFEGASLMTEWAPPQWWWSAWFFVAMALAAFRQWSPRYFVHLGWAWTDYRLLLQSRGDFMSPWYSGWMQNATAGAALSLACAGMVARAGLAPLDPALVLRLWGLWGILMLIRWSVARIWEGISMGEIHGREWAMAHRFLLEGSAWFWAPLGLCWTVWGTGGSKWGLWCTAAFWLLGWSFRHRRTFQRIPRLLHRPVEGMLYLCALEILPVAVLIRAWQW